MMKKIISIICALTMGIVLAAPAMAVTEDSTPIETELSAQEMFDEVANSPQATDDRVQAILANTDGTSYYVDVFEYAPATISVNDTDSPK